MKDKNSPFPALSLAAVAMLATLNAPPSTVFAQAITFTNPAPVGGQYFGRSVAALETDRVLIGADMEYTGATYAGAAYLFSTNGTLLTTITNPYPLNDAWFGHSVAALGTDRVLVGAYGAANGGAAYLFGISGVLLTNFNNPAPVVYGYFGHSLAAVGTDRVLIGAGGNGTSPSHYGSAYLFSTNGTLLTTFANPKPAAGAEFGDAVAAVGNDRVLIGAYGDGTGATAAGAAYLFSTNGTLLTTFTNPTPALNDNFGISVAVMGTDRVLIGAYGDSTGATAAGAAYLFTTNAVLLTTFTNPAPAASDKFGNSVAAVGTDRVLIGAFHDGTGATDAGAAYLFSTNGTLLMTITNPTPFASDYFGCSVAALGADRVLIGAYGDNTGAIDAGSAYLFSIAGQTAGPPPLYITQVGTKAIVWWSPSVTGWTLQTNVNLATPTWGNYLGTVVNNSVTNAPPPMNLFFRLKQ